MSQSEEARSIDLILRWSEGDASPEEVITFYRGVLNRKTISADLWMTVRDAVKATGYNDYMNCNPYQPEVFGVRTFQSTYRAGWDEAQQDSNPGESPLD